ncbi:MAG: hypothetical protein ACYDHA_05905 [Bellilinea sp.]
MGLYLLDDTLSVEVFYEPSDGQFPDNVCLRLWESCPAEEKIFVADETNVYLTPDQARELAKLLLTAVAASEQNNLKSQSELPIIKVSRIRIARGGHHGQHSSANTKRKRQRGLVGCANYYGFRYPASAVR